mmetsp:Transcript_64216/g.150767  ORF Transcript_64216/g.150767 Transcript_64216/m.150767 type:complete len:294 (-) Transcript_64216:564-1445(-)
MHKSTAENLSSGIHFRDCVPCTELGGTLQSLLPGQDCCGTHARIVRSPSRLLCHGVQAVLILGLLFGSRSLLCSALDNACRWRARRFAVQRRQISGLWHTELIHLDRVSHLGSHLQVADLCFVQEDVPAKDCISFRVLNETKALLCVERLYSAAESRVGTGTCCILRHWHQLHLWIGESRLHRLQYHSLPLKAGGIIPKLAIHHAALRHDLRGRRLRTWNHASHRGHGNHVARHTTRHGTQRVHLRDAPGHIRHSFKQLAGHSSDSSQNSWIVGPSRKRRCAGRHCDAVHWIT